MLDIFKNDAFSVLSLVDAMREIKYVPGFAGSLGLFQEDSIDTLDFAIEKDGDQVISLVPSSPRGSVGDMTTRTRRSMRKLTVPHFQRDDAIYADEVQGVRAFGQERAVELLQSKIARRAADHSQSFALTEEYHRLAVLTQGKLLDKDGSTLFDFYQEFGEARPAAVNFDLLAASPAKAILRERCDDIWRATAETLDGLPFTGIIALCGDAFFKALVKHKEVYDIYLQTEGVRTLQNATINPTASRNTGIWGDITFANIRFINYRNGLNVGIDTNSCYFIPQGVPGLFRTVYAPADYIETVNTPGQRMYAKQWEMPNGKGVNLEYQMNVVHYCNRPRVLRSAVLSA